MQIRFYIMASVVAAAVGGTAATSPCEGEEAATVTRRALARMMGVPVGLVGELVRKILPCFAFCKVSASSSQATLV